MGDFEDYSGYYLTPGYHGEWACSHDYRFSHYEYNQYSNNTNPEYAVTICKKCGDFKKSKV
jgi:hypothetical protein